MEDEQIFQLVKSLFRDRRMGRYHRVDLHIHSPVSTDYSGDKNVSEYDFVSAFANRGFDLIAITDHNTGAYVDRAIEARNQLAAKEGKNITVLPGVEMHVSPGIHLLAILPVGGSAAIADLLSHLGLHVDKHGDTDALISKSAGEIADSVHERGGLLIGALCNSNKGVVQVLNGQPRLEWLSALDALEISSETTDDKIDRDINYVSDELGVSIPFIYSSDSHDCASETDGMWVKMADSTLASLRQLVFEPQLRVSRVEPAPPSHGRVVGFTTTHGLYGGERFRFSPNLNVLIGGRGAGKSAAIDVLRFAVGAEPRSGDINEDVFANRIAGFLQGIGEVAVVMVGSDGNTYIAVRSGKYEKTNARAKPVFTDPGAVFQIIDNQVFQVDHHPLDVLGIEFYGQGEAARLADRVDEQLRLIDENLDLSCLEATIAQTQHNLALGEDQLIEQNTRLEELRIEAAKRPQLEQRRDDLSKLLEDPIFAERSRWDRDKEWVQRQQSWVRGSLNGLPQQLFDRPPESIEIDKSPAKSILRKIQHCRNAVLATGQFELYNLRKTLMQAIADLEVYQAEWIEAFEVAEKRYVARLTEMGAENKEQIAVELRGVQQEIARLTSDVDPQVAGLETAIQSLKNERLTQMATIRTKRQDIRIMREGLIHELNQKLGGSVTVDLSESDRSRYVAVVDQPLEGSGMQRRAEQVALVCESFSPEELVGIIRCAATDRLVEVGITRHSASLMMSKLTEEILYKIERVDVPPSPKIRLKREGEEVLTELTALSVGEKCSAILSIAMLSKGKPLIIDQPEDDLDHAFIIGSIVEGIRTAKSGRQIIAASHNPNIPVLGDAEMIFRVARQPGNNVCKILASGGLEVSRVTSAVQNLEGGAEAFERRRQRYSNV